jgi:SAM-dependent methyltransferase
MPVSQILDNSTVWTLSRVGLDASFGLYRHRLALLKRWGILGERPSVIDLGCGTGQYCRVTNGTYVGVDMNPRYIAHARRTNKRPNVSFRCVDVAQLLQEHNRYDIALMVDFIHHLPDELAVGLLRTMGSLSRGHVVNFEPILEQRNPIGRWIINNDRGDFIRSRDQLRQLYEDAGLCVIRDEDLQLGPILTSAVLARGLARQVYPGSSLVASGEMAPAL